ncbi:MAG: hypothetical protein ACRDHL_14085, partial [Candidatus Promineifilaceae bacterium]
LVLFYTPASFYAWNASDAGVPVAELAFDAVDAEGHPAGFGFAGASWALYFPLIEPGKCDRIDILGAAPADPPAECQGYNAVVTPQASEGAVFWIERPGVSRFRVLYAGVQVGQCPLGRGECQVALPAPAGEG